VTFPVMVPVFEHPITPSRRTEQRTARGKRVLVLVGFIHSSFEQG
jgi:hypothetical protein